MYVPKVSFPKVSVACLAVALAVGGPSRAHTAAGGGAVGARAMTFRVVVVFSRTAKLVTLANVIAEGARAVSGADVRVVRAREAREVTSGTNGTSTSYERGILDAEIATPEDVLEADCVLIGAPTRRGIVATEMSAFLERLGDAAAGRGGAAALKGKIAGAFTEVGESGIGGHEMVLMSAHAWFMQHGMIVVGAPPAPMTTESSGVATALGENANANANANSNANSNARLVLA